VVRKNWGEMNLEFKIRNLELLNELGNKRMAGLALRVAVPDITREFVDTLDQLCRKNAGQAALRLYLRDEAEAMQTELLARNSRIKPNNALIRELKKLAEVGVITDRNEVRWLTDVVQTPAAAPAEVGTISPTFVLEPVD
jgi:DNA polymerase-3 subunit alpha